MTRIRMLAGGARPLADVLIDRLRSGGHPLKWLRNSHDDDENDWSQPDLPLRQDEGGAGKPAAIHPVRPDEIAAAVLLGQALDGHRDVLRRFRNPDLIAIVEVPTAEFVAPTARLLRLHVLGGEAPVLDGNGLNTAERTVAAPGTVAIFKDRDADKPKRPSDAVSARADFAIAMQRCCAVIGVSADPERLLPRELIDLAERRIVIAPLNGGTLAKVIEAVTARHPGVIDDELVRGLTLETLAITVRSDLGAARSLTRLKRLLNHEKSKGQGLRLNELHGFGAARDWALILVRDLKDYAAGRLPWVAVDRGCLLTGAPGTGKTTLARIVAQEAGVFFLATSYAQWQAHREGHLGHVTQAIRNAFAEALQHRPAIMFIDEIDTIPARGSGKWNDDWWTAITNVLLECLDGFERREGVVVIAACNDPSRLDPALVRAGRLDRHVEIPLPDVPALMGIFRSHLGGDLQGVDLRPAALAARGHTGADVERWVREARGRARRKGHGLTEALLLDAVRGGSPELPLAVRRRVATHESGHAIATLVLGLAEPVALSIGASGGLAQAEPGEMRAQTRAHLEQYLIVLLAGRAAEELVFGEATAGAGGSSPDSDIGRATTLAMRIESSYGLGASGLLWLAAENPHDLALHRDLQRAVRTTLDTAYAAAKELLAANRASLDALAAALVGNGYLDRAEIEAVLTRVPLTAAGAAETLAVQEQPAGPMPAAGPPEADTTGDQTSSPALAATTAGNVEA